MRVCFKVVLPFPDSQTLKFISVAKHCQSLPALKSGTGDFCPIPSKEEIVFQHSLWKALVSTIPWILACCATGQLQWFEVEDGLGGAWKQHQEGRRQCCCCLHRLEQCFAVHESGGHSWLHHLGLLSEKSSTGVLHLALSNLNLEAGGPVCLWTLGVHCLFEDWVVIFFFWSSFPQEREQSTQTMSSGMNLLIPAPA